MSRTSRCRNRWTTGSSSECGFGGKYHWWQFDCCFWCGWYCQLHKGKKANSYRKGKIAGAVGVIAGVGLLAGGVVLAMNSNEAKDNSGLNLTANNAPSAAKRWFERSVKLEDRLWNLRKK